MTAKRRPSRRYRLGDTPLCRYCDCVLTADNWPDYDLWHRTHTRSNYACRPCANAERARHAAIQAADGRPVVPRDVGRDLVCSACGVRFSSNSTNGKRCPRCRVEHDASYNRSPPWRWLYSSVSGANVRNDGRGALTIAGMRSKWTGDCYWCKRGLKVDGVDRRRDPRGATIDHVVPVARGGENVDSNAVWACWTCNMSKRGQMPDEWLETIRLVLQNRGRTAPLYSLNEANLPAPMAVGE